MSAGPLAFDLLLRKRRYILPVVAPMLLTLAAIPACQAYASSNLSLWQNPFSPSRRTPGTVVRGYITTHPDGDLYAIVGLDQSSWWWTPGSGECSCPRRGSEGPP